MKRLRAMVTMLERTAEERRERGKNAERERDGTRNELSTLREDFAKVGRERQHCRDELVKAAEEQHALKVELAQVREERDRMRQWRDDCEDSMCQLAEEKTELEARLAEAEKRLAEISDVVSAVQLGHRTPALNAVKQILDTQPAPATCGMCGGTFEIRTERGERVDCPKCCTGKQPAAKVTYVSSRSEDDSEFGLSTAEAWGNEPLYRTSSTGGPMIEQARFKAESWEAAKEHHKRLCGFEPASAFAQPVEPAAPVPPGQPLDLDTLIERLGNEWFSRDMDPRPTMMAVLRTMRDELARLSASRPLLPGAETVEAAKEHEKRYAEGTAAVEGARHYLLHGLARDVLATHAATAGNEQNGETK